MKKTLAVLLAAGALLALGLVTVAEPAKTQVATVGFPEPTGDDPPSVA